MLDYEKSKELIRKMVRLHGRPTTDGKVEVDPDAIAHKLVNEINLKKSTVGAKPDSTAG